MLSLFMTGVMVGCLIWGFFAPGTAAWVYIVLIAIFEGWIAGLQFLARPTMDSDAVATWAPREQAALRKYHLYFRWPFASQAFSSTLSGTQLAAFVWVPWLLWNGHWWAGAIIGANYFLAGPLAAKLNPRLFLHEAVEKKGQYEYMEEMVAVDAVCERIIEERTGGVGNV